MAKKDNKKPGNTIPGTFTALPHVLKDSGFDIYEIIIISEIQSWNRQDKKFYVSKKTIAEDYKCDRKTIIRRFDKLVNLGVLYKGKRVHKGQYQYLLNVDRLMFLIKEYKDTKDSCCTSKVQQTQSDVPQGNTSCTSGVHNNNTKNISKNILRVEEETSGVSSSPGQSKLEITLDDINELIKTIDIE